MKKILSIITVVFMLLSLVACDSNNDASDDYNGNDFEWEQLEWPTYDNAKQIPIPKSVTADVRNKNDIRFDFYLADTTYEDYKSYVEECKTKGFTVDAVEQENRYYAFNDSKYELTVQYHDGDIMYVQVVEDRCEVEIKLLHTTKDSAKNYDIKIEIDGYWEEDGEKGKEAITFDSHLKEGNHTLIVENDDDDDINGRIDFVVTDDEEYFEFEITCLSNKIDIKQITGIESSVEDSNKKEPLTSNDENLTEKDEEKTNNNTIDNNYVSNGVFTYNARTFMKRFDKADMDGCNYVYARTDDENLYYEISDIEDSYRSVGMIGFDKFDGTIMSINDDYTESIIGKINILVEEAEDVPSVLVACMCATDPTLTTTSAFNVGQKIVECAGTSEGYTYNNINYVIVTDDEYYYIIITPA